MQQLGLEYVQQHKTKTASRGWKVRCPGCDGNDLWYTPGTGTAYCFECGSSYRVGDTVYKKRSQGSFDINSIRETYHKAADTYRAYLTEEHIAYLAKRGISKQDIDTFTIGYCPDGTLPLYHETAAYQAGIATRENPTLAGRIVFPYYASGMVTDLRGRATGQEEPRYRSPNHQASYRGAIFPYNFDRARKRLEEVNTLLVTEGEIKTILADINGYACVGFPGMTTWRHGITQLRAKRTVVIFDSSYDAEDRLRVDRAIYRLSIYIPQISVAVLPLLGEAKQDIDSFLTHPKGGREYFDYIVDRAVSFRDYRALRRF